MNYYNLKHYELRNDIERSMAIAMQYTFKKIFAPEENVIYYTNEALDMLDNVFDNYSEDEINKIIGGELNKDVVYRGGDQYKDKTSMPVFLELDLLKASLESDFLPNTQNRDKIIAVLDRIEKLRNKATTLKYDSAFEPDQQFSKTAIDAILASKGNLKFNKNQQSKMLEVSCTYIHEKIEYRGGDYVSRGATYSEDAYVPLYQRDYDKKREENNKIFNEKYKDFIKKVGKYFKGNEIPHTSTFHESLVNEDIDYDLKITLFEIISKLDKNFGMDREFLDSVQPLIGKLEKREVELEQAIVKEKEQAIEKAREKYRSKNFFWRFINRKIRPEKQNFETMSISEINNLYGGKTR